MTKHISMNEYKMAFIKKHTGSSGDWKIETGPIDEYGKYCRLYFFDDGAQMTEINRPVWELVEVEVKGISVTVPVKLFETEIWNTDDATSYKWYEKF